MSCPMKPLAIAGVSAFALWQGWPLLLEFLAPVSALYARACAATAMPPAVAQAYTWLYTTFGMATHPVLFFAVFTFLFHLVVFWGISAPFVYLDLTQRPKWLYAYKLQKTVNSRALMWKAAKAVLWNQVFILLPAVGAVIFKVHDWAGSVHTPEALPSGAELLVGVIVCVLVEEVGFYYTHLILHQPFFYARVHKQHHEFKAPVGFAALYAHPFEFIFSDALPLMAGTMVCRAHLVTMCAWWVVALFGTITHHSGYNFPWLVGTLSPKLHDWHHEKFEVHYGLLGWLDWLHGTDKLRTKRTQAAVQPKADSPQPGADAKKVN